MNGRDDEKAKAPWRGENHGKWRTVHGIKMAQRAEGVWGDWGEHYIVLDLHRVREVDIEYTNHYTNAARNASQYR